MPAVNVKKLTAENLAELLRKAGSKIATPGLLVQCVERGAPANPDGTFNLIDFSAWLARMYSSQND